MEPSVLTIDQLGRRLQIGRTTIYRRMGTDALPPHIRIGKAVRFPIKAVERFEAGGGSADDTSPQGPAS